VVTPGESSDRFAEKTVTAAVTNYFKIAPRTRTRGVIFEKTVTPVMDLITVTKMTNFWTYSPSRTRARDSYPTSEKTVTPVTGAGAP
jgi:hypothetical protein